MDIKGLINNKVNEMLENKDVKNLITENIEKSIAGAIKDTLGGYSFKRAVEEKLKVEVDKCLDEISFKGYNKLFLDRITAVITQIQDQDMVEKIDTYMKDLFIGDKELVLSEFFEEVRSYFITDDIPKYEENFYLNIDWGDEDSYGFQHAVIKFDEEEPSYGEANYTIGLMKYDNKWKITDVDLEDLSVNISNKSITKIGNLNSIERILLRAYFNESKVIVDIDGEDDVDTSLWRD